ncbi:MAG: hypothetical protein M1358_20710 [Chloroflexi bacterium]|nr:hypothetical protein [Chloroflexota bacterium]
MLRFGAHEGTCENLYERRLLSDSYVEQGFVKEKPDLKKVVDTQHVDCALSQPGKYQKWL